MKLFIQSILLIAFAAFTSAAERQLGKAKKSFAFKSDDDNDVKAVGEAGCRQECSDKRFTMVCEWEATKKQSKSKSHKKSRRLGTQDALDYEEENQDSDKEMSVIDVGGGRRLKVGLTGVNCILGVGKKDSDDSSEDYEEYKERLSFPSDKWQLKIAQIDDETDNIDYGEGFFKFGRSVEFEGIEDPNNSADEITIKGSIEIELICIDDTLIIDGQKVNFSC